MEQKRPTALTVMGILNIVLGSLGLLCTCFGGLMLLFLANPPAELRQDPNIKAVLAQMEFVAREVPSYKAVTVSQLVAGLLLTLLLIVTGIGLLYVKKWARIGCFFYCVSTVLLNLAGLAYALLVVNPAQARFQPAGGGDGNIFNNLISVVSALFGVAYAVILLIVLLLPGVAAAFAPQPAGTYPEGDKREGYDDPGYERPPEDY